MFEEWYANLPEEDKAIEDKKSFARAGFIAGYNAVEHLLALDGLYCQFCGELLSEHLVTKKGGHCEPARK